MRFRVFTVMIMRPNLFLESDLSKQENDINKIKELSFFENMIKEMNDKIVIKGVINLKSVSKFKSKTKLEKVNEDLLPRGMGIDTNEHMLAVMGVDCVDKSRLVSDDIHELSNFGY